MNEAPSLILLDRDGVLNEVEVDPEQGTIDSPLHPDRVRILPGVPESLAILNRAGFALRIVTNQPAAAKGKTTADNLWAVQRKVIEGAEAKGAKIAGSHICFHRQEDGCACRKPRTGLLEEALRAHPGTNPTAAWMVGDGITDIEAGAAMGMKTAFIGPRKSDAAKLLAKRGLAPSVWVESLEELAELLAGGGAATSFSKTYLEETVAIVQALDTAQIDKLAAAIAGVRQSRGRLFVLGVGGSAGHASHAVNDFRKLCGVEAYAPTDNVSELTARVNDEGWDTTFTEWLAVSRLSARDAILIFSVGGGNREKNVSVNLIRAIERAQAAGARILGIVGRDGGHTARSAEACVVIPPLAPERITPHTEGLCAVVWHLLVSHPALQINATKWESMGR